MRAILALLILLAATPVFAGSTYVPPAATASASATPAGSSGDIQTNGGSGTFGSINTSSGLKASITDELAPDGASSKVLFALGGISIATGKTAVFSNSLTLAGTDGSTLNVGTGGTLGTSAYITLGSGVATALAAAANATGGFDTINGVAVLTNKSIAATQITGGLNVAQMTTVANDATAYLPITFALKSQAITTGVAHDLGTITIPAGITRWRISTSSAATNAAVFVNETQTGTMATGTVAAFDAAGGGGTQLFATTAPAATSSPTINVWQTSASVVLSTSSSIVVRQMAASGNTGTISFYITIIPIN